MDPEGYSLPQATGKIRVRASHGGRSRAKPYLRKDKKITREHQAAGNPAQGFFGKVTSYIIPTWVSNWFTGKKETKDVCPDDVEQSSEVSSSDEELPESEKVSTKNECIGNHLNREASLKNLTSTPLLTHPSFSIISSSSLNSSETKSNMHHKKSSETSERRLFSREENEVDIEAGNRREIQKTDKQSSVHTNSLNASTKSNEMPQKFLMTETKPTFKVASFLSSSPLIPGGSYSTFYPGRTSFGGASSFQSRNTKRQKISPVVTNAQTKRTNIKPKSLPTSRTGAITSQTARKILGALERMSSPVLDASKLPNSPSAVLFNPLRRRDNSLTQSPSGLSVKSNQPPTQLLQAPRTMKIQQTRIYDKSDDFESIFTPEVIRPGVSVGTFRSRGLPTSFSPEDNNRGGGKMKRQRQYTHHSAAPTDSSEEPVNVLPPIKQSVPLPVTSLPKFDFGVINPLQPTKSSTLESARNIIEPDKNSTLSKTNAFKFSKPQKIASNMELPLSTTKESNFQFSIPCVKESDITDSESQKKKEVSSNLFGFTKKSDVIQTKSTEDEAQNNAANVADYTVANQSQLDMHITNMKPKNENTVSSMIPKQNIWGKKESEWECSTCLVMNKIDKSSCACCETPKPGSSHLQKSPEEKKKILANIFKPAVGSWECSACLVRNKPDTDQCVACETKKSSSETKEKVTITVSKNSTAVTCSSSNSNLLKAKFSPAPGSWECETCMVRNKQEASACAACDSPKPGVTSCSSSTTSVSFGTPASVTGFRFGTGNVSSSNSITFGSGPSKNDGFAFSTSGTTTSFSFGSKDPKSVTFGVPSGASVSLGFCTGDSKGSIFDTSAAGDKKTSVPNKFENSSLSTSTEKEKSEKDDKNKLLFSMPTNSGSSDNPSKGFSFGVKNIKESSSVTAGFCFDREKTESSKLPAVVGFKFQTANDNRPNEESQSEVDSKTTSMSEENNNRIVFATQPAMQQGSCSTDDKKLFSFSNPHVAENKSSFSTIADAAKAGFLKVPEMEQTSQSSEVNDNNVKASMADSTVATNGPAHGGKSCLKTNAIATEAVQSSIENSSMQSTETVANLFKPTVQTEAAGNLFGVKQSATFSFSAPSSQAGASTLAKSTFSFGASSNVTIKPAVSNDNPSFVFNKNPATEKTLTVFESSKSEKETNSNEQNPFKFSSGTVNPFSFQPKTAEQSQNQNTLTVSKSEEARPIEFKNSSFPSIFSGIQSNQEPKFNNNLPLSNTFSVQQPGTVLSGGFNFGTKPATTTPSGEPSSKTANQTANFTGFSFGAPSVPDTTLFTDSVARTLSSQTSDKPFNFTAAVQGANSNGGFNFANSSSNPFTANIPSASQTTAGLTGFNFSSIAANPGAFSFTGNAGSGSTPMFSSGQGAAAVSQRQIKKAVRRRK